jgi:4-alpha-glucanotransferase
MGWIRTLVLGLCTAFIAQASDCPSKVRASAPPTLNDRAAGVLLAVSSLAGDGPVGDFGDSAFEFVEFLSRAKQRWWQILPLNPPDEVNSPFKSDSSLAIDIAYLSPKRLVSDGLIDAAPAAVRSTAVADYHSARLLKRQVVAQAHERFARTRPPALGSEFVTFQRENAYWLEAHADFEVLRSLHGFDFTKWPAPLRERTAKALSEFRRENAMRVEAVEFEQFLLHRQWNALRTHAHAHGVGIIGDMPLYVGRYSADVWSNRDAFILDEGGNALMVSGYPPCSVYRDGQLWDTPVYDWQGLKRTKYAFWVNRLKRNFALYDVVRLDHFMGLHQFYAVNAGQSHARFGQWLQAGGSEMLSEVQAQLGKVPLVAEDLGASIPDELHALRKRFGIPGMRITQFGYHPQQGDPYHRSDSFEPQSVAYPGNHDMPTLAQWMHESGSSEHLWPKLDSLYGSKANTVIVSAQDWLGLGAEARMNLPGTWATASNPAQRRQNWVWRLLPGALGANLERDLEAKMGQAGR